MTLTMVVEVAAMSGAGARALAHRLGLRLCGAGAVGVAQAGSSW